MKVDVAQQEPEFQPVELVITLETAEEVRLLEMAMAGCRRIAEMTAEAQGLSGEEQYKMERMLREIYSEIYNLDLD